MLPLFYYTAMALWLATEIYYAKKFKSTNTDAKDKDKASLKILWATIVASIALSQLVTFSTPPAPIFKTNICQWVGLILIYVGIVGRFLIIRQLGKYFTVDVTIKKDHQLKTDGIYGIVRHPSYSFSILTFVGLAVFLNHWVGSLLALLPIFAFMFRIKVEENALIAAFGQQYVNYKKKTKALVPFVV